MRRIFKEAGFPISEEQEKRFFIYLEELKKWNKRINLTSIESDAEIIKKLFVDSLAFALPIKSGREKRVLDLGSGAGFPGLPIKILFPDIFMTLLEASKKKTAFLKHICRRLEIPRVECIAKRSEDLISEKERLCSYDAVLSRGAGSAKRLARTALPLLKNGGLLITEKGTGRPGEEGAFGLRLINTVPFSEKGFTLLVFQKCFT